MPAGAWYIQPGAVDPSLAAILLQHRFPGRAPAGKGLLSAFADSPFAEKHIDTDDDDAIVPLALEGLDRILPRLSDTVEFVHVKRWNHALPVYPAGYTRRLAKFQLMTRSVDRRIQLAGDYFSPTSTDAATAAGERAARELMAAIGRPATQGGLR